MTAQDLMDALQAHASDSDAANLSWFFKTGAGEYGEGDQFLGVRVPVARKICRDFTAMPLDELQTLLSSPFHEHRLAATIIMAGQYKKVSDNEKEKLYKLYVWGLDAKRINNWDIVDTSCEHIVGAHGRTHGDEALFKLATGDLWHKRAAIVSCFAWLRSHEVGPTMELAEILWPERHDLLQKATGWMLRETEKYVDEQLLLDFLDRHAHEMPRTCLRYAIEKLPEQTRQFYMAKKALS